MSSAAALRIQIERAMEHRFPAALTPVPRTIREVAATGVSEVDVLLDGGLPVGAISELTGPQSSGRTSLALAFVAQRTRTEHVCAWVDSCNAFDPESAAASGVSLQQLLWVRCTDSSEHDLAVASAKSMIWKRRPWTRLDQAVRATDLLLQAGGFAAIVLDLGDTAPEHGNRIPLATWFRFRQAADRTRCCLVVLAKAAYAQSSAALVLECSAMHAKNTGETVLRGLTFEAQQGRVTAAAFTPVMNLRRKPPATTWSVNAAWQAEKRV
ncbi:MAG: hypothetical protein WAM85_17330 [Terracidiphilus sp.]